MSVDPDRVERSVHTVGGGSIEIAAVSDIGRVRSENQDRFGCVATPEGVAIALADGLGGGGHGGEAAAAALQAVLSHFGDGADPEAAVRAATEAVGRVRATFGGGIVGTTLVAACLTLRSLQVVHVGDSRAYMCDAEGGFRILTRDHSAVADLVVAGELTSEQARRDSRRSMLTRAVTGDPVVPEIVSVDWDGESTLALCSDGIWEAVEDELLGRLWATGDLARAAAGCCSLALEAGSRDNVTVVLARHGQVED